MQNDFIRNLLDLKGVMVKKVRYKKNFVKIHIEMPVREQTCPCCKSKTTKIKDYRTQIIKDLPIRFKTTLLSYRKRRYECKNCGKTFYEKVSFLPKRVRKTTRVIDLWKPYQDLAKTYCPNAKIVADKFHFARHVALIPFFLNIIINNILYFF